MPDPTPQEEPWERKPGAPPDCLFLGDKYQLGQDMKEEVKVNPG